MPQLSISKRTRSTPFTDRVTQAGVKAYTVYNHMLLATVFRSLEEDYHHLKSAVQIWDVSCERQVELTGPDAGRLAQMMTPRDLSRQRIGQCLYSPVCDKNGYLLNDPVTIKRDQDRYWVSIADSDVKLFAKGLAAALGLDVSIQEPDIFPLAVQGPKATDLMVHVFGEAIRSIKFFGTMEVEFGGRSHLVARSGYSVQGGFEIYLSGADLAPVLWDTLMEAGKSLDVRAGCPNLIERIEGGLLSYGNDISDEHTLAETGLARFCATIAPESVAYDALALQNEFEPTRQLRYLKIDGPPLDPTPTPITLLSGQTRVGEISSRAWSPDYQTNVAIGMIDATHFSATDTMTAEGDPVTILPGPIVMSEKKEQSLTA